MKFVLKKGISLLLVVAMMLPSITAYAEENKTEVGIESSVEESSNSDSNDELSDVITEFKTEESQAENEEETNIGDEGEVVEINGAEEVAESVTTQQIPSDASLYKGNYYKIYTTRTTWSKAKAACESLGGHLATITTADEQAFIEKVNSKNLNLWIGATRGAGAEWTWVTNEIWNYTHWGSGEPNNSSNVVSNENCVAIWPKYWNDMNDNNTSEQSGYVCEWELGGTVSGNQLRLTKVVYSYENNNIDVLTQALSIESDHEAFELQCTPVNSSATISRYELYYGNKLIDTSDDGKFSVDLTNVENLNVSDSKRFLVKTVGEDCMVTTPLLLTIKDKSCAVPDSLSLFGEGMETEIDSDFPLLGGDKLSFEFPEIPVSATVEDGKIKIGINLSKNTITEWDNKPSGDRASEDYKTPLGWIEATQNSLNNFKKDYQQTKTTINVLKNMTTKKGFKAKVPGFSGEVDFNIVGYLEGSWSEDKSQISTISGELLFVLSWEATVQKQSVVMVASIPVPIVIQLDTKIEGKASGKVIWDLIKEEVTLQATAALSNEIEPYGGIGWKTYLSGGVYGNLGLGTDFTIASNATTSGIDDITIDGSVGVKGYFAKKEGKWSIWSISELKKSKKYKDYINDDGKLLLWSRNEKSLTNNPETEGTNGAQIEEAVILSNNAAAIADSLTLSADQESLCYSSATFDDVLVSNVYGGATPQIITAGDTTVMVYVDNVSDRSGANQTAIMYRVYDSEAGTFSDPLVVYDDGTADYKPQLVTNGTDIYLSYLNSSKTYDADEDPDTDVYLGTFGVSVAKFENGTFKNLGKVSEHNYASFQSKVYATDSGVGVVWTENSDNAIFGLSENNSIYYREYDGTSWGETKTIATGKKSIGDLAIGKLSGNLMVAYTEDADNDLTTEEQSLVIYNLSDESSNSINACATSLQFTTIANVSDGNVLAYNNGGGISYLTSQSGESQELTSSGVMDSSADFVVDGNNIYYLKTADSARNIGVIEWNGEKWLNTFLTDEEGYIDNFSINNGRITYLSTTAEVESEDEITTSSSIKFINSIERNDLTLDYVDYSYSDTAVSGNLPVVCTVANNGTKKISSVTISVYNGDTQVQDPVSYDVEIEPGESAEINTTLTLPEDLTGKTYKFTISDGEDDANSDDNSYDVNLGRTELSVSMAYEVGSSRIVKVTTSNESCVATNATTVVTDANGTELLNVTDTIAGKSTAVHNITIKDNMLGSEGSYYILTAETSTSDTEYYTSNNYTDQAIWSIDAENPEVSGGGTNSTSGKSSDGTILWTIDDSGLIYITGEDSGELTTVCWADETSAKMTSMFLDNGVLKLGDDVLSNITTLQSVTFQNDSCVIEDSATTIPSGTTIKADYGSTAYEYAIKYGRTFEALDADTHTHLWDDGVVTVEATTDNNGEIKYTCKYCGETKTETVHALGGHVYVESESESVEPTCTTAGTRVSYCKWCNEKSEESLPMLEHNWDEGTVTKESSEGRTGIYTYTCKACGATKTEDIYEIVYDLEGGTISNQSAFVSSYIGNGNNVVLPTEDDFNVEPGYSFEGWYTSQNFNEDEKITEITSDTYACYTLFAKWTTKKLTVNFDKNDGNKGGTTKSVVINGRETTALTANGFKDKSRAFIGWALKKDATTPDFVNKENVILSIRKETTDGVSQNVTKINDIDVSSYVTNGAITLYAIWSDTFSITYINDGETYATDTYTYGKNKALNTTIKTAKPGYTFLGWYNESGKKISSITSKNVGDVTLTAQWKANTYTVIYKQNVSRGVSGKMSNTKMTYDVTGTLRTNTFKYPGYKFIGWATSKDATEANYSDGAQVLNLAQNGSVTLYAVWEKTGYTVTYDLMCDASLVTGGQPENLAYNYSASSGESLITPERANFTFKGWYRDSAFKKKITTTKGLSEDITVYAKWTTTYEIHFNGNGGTAKKAMANQKMDYATAKAISANQYSYKDKSGNTYVFMGWDTDVSADEVVYTNKQKIISPDAIAHEEGKYVLNLYAVWENQWGIVYESNDGIMPENVTSTYTFGQGITTLPTPSKDGYRFAGWYTNNKFKSKITSISKKAFGAQTLYAKWTPLTYKIYFNANVPSGLKKTGSTSTQTISYGVTKALNKNCYTIKGYDFLGWSTDQNATTPEFTDKQKISGFGEYKSAVTLYAIWAPTQYKVTYMMGDNADNVEATYTINSGYAIESVPEKIGYRFAGYYTDKKYKTKAKDYPVGTTGNKVIYVKWVENK